MPVTPDPVPATLTVTGSVLGTLVITAPGARGLFDPAIFDSAIFDTGGGDPMPFATGTLTLNISADPGGLTLTEE